MQPKTDISVNLLEGDGTSLPLESEGWLPIKTAPRNGSELLLCDDEGIRTVGRWSKHNHVPFYGWVRQVDIYGEEVDGFDAVWWAPLLPAPPKDTP